jgi:hypothetical protein
MQQLSGQANLSFGVTASALSSHLGVTINRGASLLQELSGDLLSRKRIRHLLTLTREPMSSLLATTEVQFWDLLTATQNGSRGGKFVWLARIRLSVRSVELFGS